MTDAPSKTAQKRAHDLWDSESREYYTDADYNDALFTAFARYINAHEPQEDPDLLTAREAVARQGSGHSDYAEEVRAGERDDDYPVQTALAAIKLSWERGE